MKLIIEGRPVISVCINDIPTWNESIDVARKLGSTRRSRSGSIYRKMEHTSMTRQWRSTAYYVMLEHMRAGKVGMLRQAFVLIRVSSLAHRWDVHNPWIKPILDGFTDAGLWEDDSYKFVPAVMPMWSPNWAGAKRACEFVIYELEEVIINGHIQELPA